MPLVYLLNDELKPLQKFYLGDPEAMRKAARWRTRAKRAGATVADQVEVRDNARTREGAGVYGPCCVFEVR